ncbi:MAG: formate/nitrite transporter family protein [Pseudomonadota bacterium]
MTEDNKEDGSDPSNMNLSYTEERDALERAGPRAPVVYAAISARGNEEMRRPLISLAGSGVSAGLVIMVSVVAEGLLHMVLPEFAGRSAVSDIGYTLGFIIVILGRMQLFTEDTVTPVLPLLAHPSAIAFARTGRLWVVVFAANLVGTFIAALMLTKGGIVTAEQLEAILYVSAKVQNHGPLDTMLLAIPAGFLIAALVWCMPSARGNELLLIFFITYAIALGDFAHVIAGSGEAFLLLLNGQADLRFVFVGYIAPAFAGNVLGGTVLFATLAYVQVMEEIAAKKR